MNWTKCADRMPPDFECVLIRGRELGLFVGSLKRGVWRVHTPMQLPDGRRVQVELDDDDSVDEWAPIFV